MSQYSLTMAQPFLVKPSKGILKRLIESLKHCELSRKGPVIGEFQGESKAVFMEPLELWVGLWAQRMGCDCLELCHVLCPIQCSHILYLCPL